MNKKRALANPVRPINRIYCASKKWTPSFSGLSAAKRHRFAISRKKLSLLYERPSIPRVNPDALDIEIHRSQSGNDIAVAPFEHVDACHHRGATRHGCGDDVGQPCA